MASGAPSGTVRKWRRTVRGRHVGGQGDPVCSCLLGKAMGIFSGVAQENNWLAVKARADATDSTSDYR
jgi:hypothetical protein